MLKIYIIKNKMLLTNNYDFNVYLRMNGHFPNIFQCEP